MRVNGIGAGWIAVSALAAGCSSTGKSGEDEGGVDGCGFAEPDDLKDVLDDIPGDGRQCEDAPLYETYEDFQWYTLYYAGDFDIDDCGVVTGVETWQVFPGDKLRNAGMDDCEIVFDVAGSKGDPTATGDFGVVLTADVNVEKTTCIALDDRPLYEGEEHMELAYDVDIDSASGGSAVYFPSGNLLGNGYGNTSHVSYLTDWQCASYTVAY